MLSGLALLGLASGLAWALFVATAPVPPDAEPSPTCPPSAIGFVRSASARIAFGASVNKCWSTIDQASNIDQWYEHMGWKYGGRVGGYWNTFNLDLGPVSVWGWRRAFAFQETGAVLSLLMNVEVNIDLFRYR